MEVPVHHVNCEPKIDQELVLFVGPPASGKTYFYQNILLQYTHINRDILGSKEACLKKAREALYKGESVVIDNTNPDRKSRQSFINLAQERNIPVRCVVFRIPKDICRHNNCFRKSHHNKERKPSIAANLFFSKFEEPNRTEGFQDIIPGEGLYNGNFSHGRMDGHGSHIWPDGTSYTGTFQSNKISGDGVFEW